VYELASDVTGRHRGPKRKLVTTTHVIIFHRPERLHYNPRYISQRRVWYRALSLHYACIRSAGIIRTLG